MATSKWLLLLLVPYLLLLAVTWPFRKLGLLVAVLWLRMRERIETMVRERG